MRISICVILVFVAAIENGATANDEAVDQQLQTLLKRFPKADANKDGKLTVKEARAFQRSRKAESKKRGAQTQFKVDPGWKLDRFPDDAVCYKSPAEIQQIYSATVKANRSAITSYDKPDDGALRIVGTGHSFMAPGYKTFPVIVRASGLKQPPLLTHVGGGMTGSARYKWEQENGIFQFQGKPQPKLLASISNASWDAMTWGPYFNDEPEYYSCWIEFCLKYNPKMKFFLSDAWPQLGQLPEPPKSESDLTLAVVKKMGDEKNVVFAQNVGQLNSDFPNRVFVMPTSDAMVLAVREFRKGNLPGIEGLHKSLGGKERSLWVDPLGHLGPGLGNLEGYVFYSTIYGKSPELIDANIFNSSDKSFPSTELDKVFRQIAWEAVCNHPLSGVTDKDGNGVSDELQ